MSPGLHVNGKDLVLQLRCATWAAFVSWSKTGLVHEEYWIFFPDAAVSGGYKLE